MNTIHLVRFDNDSIELYIDTTTGESFASAKGYSRMSNIPYSTVKDRVQRILSKEVTSTLVKDIEIETVQGLQRGRGITEQLICEWLPKDNPEMATKLMQLGVRSFLHTLAGYEVKSTAVNPLSPAEAIIQSLRLWEQQQKQIAQVQNEQRDQAIRLAVAEALTAQAHERIEQQQQTIDTLTSQVQLLQQMMQQPLPTCTQTLRQRIAEFTQLLATILYKKQMYSSPREAAREVWSRLLLKIKHSSSRKDIPLLRGNRLRQYDVDVLAWEAAGRPKGQKPLKKDYDWNNNQWIEFLSIEFEALTCAFAVARDFGI